MLIDFFCFFFQLSTAIFTTTDTRSRHAEAGVLCRDTILLLLIIIIIYCYNSNGTDDDETLPGRVQGKKTRERMRSGFCGLALRLKIIIHIHYVLYCYYYCLLLVIHKIYRIRRIDRLAFCFCFFFFLSRSVIHALNCALSRYLHQSYGRYKVRSVFQKHYDCKHKSA